MLLELKGENTFKSRAYSSAARRVQQMSEEELRRHAQEGRLQDIPGVGRAIGEKIDEFLSSGELAYYEDLKASLPPGLTELVKVPGLGPRKVSTLNSILGITTLGELEYACRENRLLKLKGFGARTQQKILEGIEFIRRHQGRYYFGEARAIADRLLKSAQSCPALERISLAGSLRRNCELVKDIDLVASAAEGRTFAEQFTSLPAVSNVLASGSTGVTVRLQEGINADLRIVTPPVFATALHHLTGSREHNIALRRRARDRGLTLNEYGLFREGEDEAITCRSEEELFAALGLSFIPPELRENLGEIEAAAAGTLPNLVEEGDVQGIFHIHTNYSDGVNTLEEIVTHARERNLAYLGISDHSQSAFYAGGLRESDLLRQEEEIGQLRKKYTQPVIFWGIESDIRPDGSLDYPDEILQRFDFVIASVHSVLSMEREKMTARVTRALRHPAVTILGHPTNRLLLGREASALDLEQVFQAAREAGVALELNANPARLDLDWRYLARVRELGLKVAISPDAHDLASFDDLSLGVALARKGWLEEGDVFNCLPVEEMEELLRERRRGM